jgi:hypothetical protein
MTWLIGTEYLFHKWSRICSTCRNHYLVISSLVKGFVKRIPRRGTHVEQDMPTLPEHLSWRQGFNGIRVARSLVFCVMLCRSLFVHLSRFSFQLYCQSFDLRLLITPLLFLNFLKVVPKAHHPKNNPPPKTTPAPQTHCYLQHKERRNVSLIQANFIFLKGHYLP